MVCDTCDYFLNCQGDFNHDPSSTVGDCQKTPIEVLIQWDLRKENSWKLLKKLTTQRWMDMSSLQSLLRNLWSVRSIENMKRSVQYTFIGMLYTSTCILSFMYNYYNYNKMTNHIGG